MTLSDLEKEVPELKDYTKNMPEDIRRRCRVRVHPAGTLIHQKDTELDYFGIIATGENRVINELENGNVYMIESNRAIDFIGEVTILAGMPKTSVTIEAVTDTVAAYISRKDAEYWFSQDMNILSRTASHVAYKLYRSSYHNGTKLFYPPSYLLLDYTVKYARLYRVQPGKTVVLSKTRTVLQEETGINVKTLNRTISRLSKEGFISLEKGKITMDYEQYEKSMEWLEYSRFE